MPETTAGTSQANETTIPETPSEQLHESDRSVSPVTAGKSHTSILPHFHLMQQGGNEVPEIERFHTTTTTPHFDLMPHNENEVPKIGTMTTIPRFDFLPQSENEVLTIGGSYTIPHFDLTTQSENEVLTMEESYTAPSTPRFDLMPQSEDEAPKIGALHTMPHFNLKPQNRRSISREGGCSASPTVAITQFNLMPQSGNSMSTAILPIDPLLQNGDNILAKPRGGTMDRSPRMASIPPIKVINPTPQSSLIKGQSGLREKNNGVSYLTVKNEHDSRSCSESPSSTASTNGEPITYDHLLRCAQNGVWRAAIKAAMILRLEALESQDVELLVKVNVIAEQIKSKQSPLDEPDISLHWRLINDAGEELLLNKGADVGKVARSVAQLLDEAEASEERDGVMDKWIARLPCRAP
ncbi:uncharacterized protein EI90DRAFT_3114471 [Cantharellus anzutake]|uniref:uncharacterized protein n=1 Tax=Cantharellus anzutake TaxID=1750568 RepID=UPI001908D44E|nr:uncharacterized protein EI90DRAFT_3114471 [Cantharellus anzutake]KAF8343868.1 hypothetical protein EI90DRAFT_3114471 [Cantharellus anzutake]